jgi:hypothetical protein
MSEVQFPERGQFFGVTHAGGKDGSFRDDVWECIASDEFRIVAKPVMPSWLKTHVFYRSEWVIQSVSDTVVAAVQVAAEIREQEIADQKAQRA